jgi:hypothetical protein
VFNVGGRCCDICSCNRLILILLRGFECIPLPLVIDRCYSVSIATSDFVSSICCRTEDCSQVAFAASSTTTRPPASPKPRPLRRRAAQSGTRRSRHAQTAQNDLFDRASGSCNSIGSPWLLLVGVTFMPSLLAGPPRPCHCCAWPRLHFESMAEIGRDFRQGECGTVGSAH